MILVIKTPDDKLRLIDEIQKLPNDKTYTFEYYEGEPKIPRSTKQNRTFWMWAAILGEKLGYHKNAMAEILTKEFLTPDVEIFKGAPILLYPSTKTLSQPQFSNFLKAIYEYACTEGIELPDPEDKKWGDYEKMYRNYI